MSISKPVKISAAPVWILVIVALFRAVTISVSVITLSKLRGDGASHISTRSVFLQVLFIALLLSEALLYWKIRKKIYSRVWVIAHLVLVLIPMVLVPSLFIVLPFIMDRIPGGSSFASAFRGFTYISFYLFWICLIIGNSFFVATLIKSVQFKPGLHDDTGLVDI